MRPTTPVDRAGPLARTCAQYVATEPTGGAVGPATSVIERSALRSGVTCTLTVLLAGFGSGSLPLAKPLTSYGPVSSTVPVRQRLTWKGSPGPPRLPSVHT